MAGYFKVAELADVPPGSCRSVNAAGRELALFNSGGEIFALDNTCLHRGGPLGEGDLDGDIVTCPWHGWKYNVRTGEKCGDPAKRLNRYDVKIESGEILVNC